MTIRDLPDEWLNVLLANGDGACILDTLAHRQTLDMILRTAAGGTVRFSTVEGSIITLRRNSVVGYLPSNPTVRARGRAMEERSEDPFGDE